MTPSQRVALGESQTLCRNLHSHAETFVVTRKAGLTRVHSHARTPTKRILFSTPTQIVLVLASWCHIFEGCAGTRKDSWWEDIWAHTCIAAILASSKSPNQRPWGHNRLSTCPAMYQSINLSSCWLTTSIVCVFWIFPRWCRAVLEVWDSFLTGRPNALEGMAREGKHCLTRCVQRCEGKKEKSQKQEGREKKTVRKKKVRVTRFLCEATRLFRRQDGGWSSMMMNYDGSTQHSAQYLLGAALTRAEWREEGGNSPRLLVDTEPRWREDTWGICLFISSHMLYPLQCYSESAQWGIRWTLHQLSEDGRAFLPQEQLTQTRSIESGPLEGFGWEQSFFGISLQASRLVLLFFLFYFTHHPRARSTMQRLKKKKQKPQPFRLTQFQRNRWQIWKRAWSKATLRRTAQQNFNVSVRFLIPRHSHVSYTPFCRGCVWPWKRKSPLMPRNLRNTVSKPSHYQTPFFVCLFTPYGAFGASRVKERFDSLYIPNSFDLLIEI